MRKSTINLILGILIGLIISQVSNLNEPTNSSEAVGVETQMATTTPIADKTISDPFNQVIAPGLQILEVPPPLDINGRVPYQCYFNGQPVRIPNDVVKSLLAENDHLIEKDDSVNIHNFTGNLKMIDAPVGSTIPSSSFRVDGRTR